MIWKIVVLVLLVLFSQYISGNIHVFTSILNFFVLISPIICALAE